MTGCISHQTSHTCKLFDLFIRTTGTGVSHHEDVVVFIKTVQKCFCKLIVSLLPCFNNFFITLFFCNKTTFVVLCDLVNDILCILRSSLVSEAAQSYRKWIRSLLHVWSICNP